ncbi:MAG TPA: hypothetical protein VFZ77_08990 [Acidimicrobiales bacterium]
MIRRTVLLVLALVLAAGGVACGGGDDDDAGTTGDDAAVDDTAGGEPAEDGAADDGAADESESAATELGVDRDFTGEGSEEFCAAVRELEQEYEGGGDDLAFAERMAEVTPPDEIAAEWTNLLTTLQQIGNDPSGEGMAALDPEESDRWARDGAVVAAYLGDVCGIS